MKVRVKVRPSGLLSLGGKLGVEWPEVGETVDLPEPLAKDMIAAGSVEEIKPAKKAEKKAAKKAAAKPDPAEKRPAAKADTETRKG